VAVLQKHFPRRQKALEGGYFGLPYLNSNEVPDAFTEIMTIVSCNISIDYPDYLLKNYIDSDADFRPEL